MSEHFELRRYVCSQGALLALLALALLATGCSTENPVTSDQWTWLWLAVPLLGFGLAGFFVVYYRRRSQMEAWDLRVEPKEPTPRRIILWMWGTAGSTILLFAVYNLLLEMDGDQKLSNIVLWIFGTIVGAALALYLGLRMAEPRSLPTN